MNATRPPNDVWVQDCTKALQTGDFTHPNDAGNGVMKEVVQSILDTAIDLVPALGSPPTAPAALPSRICDSLPGFSTYTSFIEGKINAYAPGSQTSLGGWTVRTTTVYVPRGIDSTNKGTADTPLGLGPVYNVPCWKADSSNDNLTLTIPAGTKELFVQMSKHSDMWGSVQVKIDSSTNDLPILYANDPGANQKTVVWVAIQWEVPGTGVHTLEFDSLVNGVFELHKVFATGKL
jgi:hypothetical protein